MRMRPILVAAIVLAAAPAFAGQAASPPAFSQRATLGPNGSVTISNINGDIVVTGGSGDEVVVEARRRDRGDGEAITPRLDVRPGRIDIRTESSGRRSGAAIDYTVTIPSSASIDAKSVSGNLRVTGVKGSVRAESVNGNVVTSGTPELDSAKSVSGNVEVTDVAANGDLSIGSVSGSVTVKGVKARALTVSSVSGDVIVTNAVCSRFSAKSVSGNVEYTGELVKGGSYDVNSHSGDVRLTVPTGVGFELTASTFSGSIRSELPLTLAPEPADQPAPQPPSGRGDRDRDRDRERRRGVNARNMRATYGNGSAVLNLRTFSGDIVIAKR